MLADLEVHMSAPTIPADKVHLTREEINRKQKEYIFPSVTTYFSDPVPMNHAFMQHVWDVEGKKYLDFFGGIVTISVGHCNPRVIERTKAQIDHLQHVSTCFPNEPMVTLAEKLAQITPGMLKKSYFTNSGTEANETAIQVARMHTGNLEVVALRHGYSGRSSLTRGLTGMNTWRKGTIEVGIVHAMNPYCYRCPLGLKYPSCEVACVKDIENVIQFSTSGGIAAFLSEPIQGVGGFITPPKEYFKMAFNIVKQYGGDFISDEVQTGWGRTGRKWFGIEHWEVEPDMITAAKGLGNGVPIGLTVAKPEIADSFQGLTISTFGGNPVSSVTAKAVIDIVEEDDLRTNAAVVGDYFRKKLEELQAKHAIIGDVRGMGLMQALELVEDRESKKPASASTGALMEEARKRGLLVGKGGFYGNVIRMSPPLNISQVDVDEAARILDESFEAIKK
jgi:4-aminobutyrate aminotransferase-like enzyme